MNGSGAVVNRFSRGVGHLIHSEHHGFYVFNVRGDVIQRVDNEGNILHTYRYDAFGNQLNGNETNTNPFRFAAEYYDWETGFIYLRARFYNPLTSRMLSEDPHWTIHNMIFGDAHIMRHGRMLPNSFAIMQASNLFVFAMNNPVRFIDPSGLFVVDAARDLGGGLRSGFVGHYQDLWHAVTNPVDTLVAIRQNAIDDPMGALVDFYVMTNPALMVARQFNRYIIAYQNDGFYGLGYGVGRDLGQASTMLAMYGVGKGVGVIIAPKSVALGTNFGKLGTLVKNDGTRVIDWAGTTSHGMRRMTERGVTQNMANSWVRTGQSLQQSGGKTLYVTPQGVVVLNTRGQVVTAYTSANFDTTMTNVVRQLFRSEGR